MLPLILEGGVGQAGEGVAVIAKGAGARQQDGLARGRSESQWQKALYLPLISVFFAVVGFIKRA